jgi:hypothetical protein
MNNPVYEDCDYGPLACLPGIWKGDSGEDIAPEPDGDERNPYYETLVFETAGDVTNAEEQTLAVVRYHQLVSRKTTGKVFHDQVGFWLWNSASGEIVQTLTIPRAVTLLAGGYAISEGGRTIFRVRAAEGDARWGIVQSPFMQEKARTLEFRHELTVEGDKLSYEETTILDIYGKPTYPHSDRNTLQRQ